MTTTNQHTAAPQAKPEPSPVTQYINDIYSSWPSVGYIRRNVPHLLQLNRGMTEKEAEQAVKDWIRNLGQA